MNDQNELLGDDQLRGAAMAAFHQYEAGVTPDEAKAALRSVRARIDAGEMGDVPALPAASSRSQPAPWRRIGVAAAVVALVAAGLAVLADRTGDKRLDPVGTPVPTALPDTTTATSSATTDPGPASTTTTPIEPPTSGDTLAIADNCLFDFNCTQLAQTEDGRIVAYDPTDDTLRVYDPAGQQVQSEIPLADRLGQQFPFLVHVGPDDVAYIAIDTPNFDDPSNDLIAIPLSGPNAGTEVFRYTGLDGSGDSSLVAQRAGLMSVGCCGQAVPRPSPGSPLYPYVDSSGARIESDEPAFRLDLGEAGNNLARVAADGTETLFNLPTVFQYPRDIPRLVATDDGGALGSDFVQLTSGGYYFIVRFRTTWPDEGLDNADVYLLDSEVGGAAASGPVLLEKAGTVIVRDDAGGFLRAALDDIGTAGWPGRLDIDIESGPVEAPGLNDYISANQPAWAAALDLLALQLVPTIDANESVQVEFDEGTGAVTITTSGFLDDSTAASRITVQTERAADGLLRVASATYGWRCQPDRGHQEFSTEPCV
jgi:hypothetical protein